MSPQTSIAHYRITTKLGEGGMGAVFRATDTKLNREVAIKIIPDVFAQDSDRMDRFHREAQVLASLNHPNIAAIYGVEEHALVLELVEGPTLADRIAQGPIPVGEALAIARQIADALEYAHERGVVHRDLKPANIKMTGGGSVKLLDFGLAKVAESPEASLNTINSPTLTMRATQAGIIMGTAAYMSPEQASGKPVDRRSDIWAFGVVLWEMLTARRLFEGETLSHTLADVLRGQIDLKQLPESTPPAVLALMGRCLDRDPRSRLRDIGEARIAIEKYLADPAAAQQAAPSAAPPIPAKRALLPWAIATAAVAAAGVVGWMHFRERPAEVYPVRFSVPLPPRMGVNSFDSAALSPDGRHLAFTAAATIGRNVLLVRSMDSLEARVIAGTDGAYLPYWSPDSRSIGFSVTGGARKVGVDGSPAVTLCETGSFSVGGSWGSSGIILLGRSAGPLMQVPESGGEPKAVFKLDAGRQETGQVWPQFLPDGKHFIFLSRSSKPELNGAYVGSLGSTEVRRLLDTDAQVRYAPPGYLLYLRQEALMAQPFNVARLELSGSAFPVAEGVGRTSQFGGGLFSASDSGALQFRSSSAPLSTLTVFDRSGRRTATVGPPGDYTQITLSPDGKRLGIDRRDAKANNYDLWLLELASGVVSRLTFDPGNERDIVFSPDGKQIVFSSDRGGPPQMFRKTIGGGPEELIRKSTERNIPEAWLKDGSILYGNTQGRKYFLLPPGGAGEPKLIYESGFTVDEPAVSPDGKWVAYGSDESGRWEVYTARFPEWTGRRQVSAAGGMQPHWRGDGKQIVYINGEGKLISLDIKSGADLDAGAPVELFSTGIRPSGTIEQFSMSPDATKFYIPVPVEDGEKPMTVVLNWWAGHRK